MLVFRDVSRRYGRVRALEHVSFTLERGAFAVLLGANGAGKSTLLRVAATLERPHAGRVRVHDTDPQDEGAAARRHVGYLGQEPGLYDELTVRENLDLVAAHFDRRFALDHAAHACGIAHKLDAPARALSRGERQRAALARALCAGELLLLDEPTSALDARGRAQVLDLLAEVRGTRTLLVATHDTGLLELADRALALDAGRLVLDGSPDEALRWMEAAA